MSDNKISKKELFWNIFSVVVAVILIAGMLCLSVFGIKVSLEQLDRRCVVYADSTNGLVENNLFSNTTMKNTGSQSSYSGLISNFIDDWSLAYGTVSWVNGVFKHQNGNSTWQGIYHNMRFVAGSTYSFTVNGYSSTGDFRIYAYDYTSGSRVTLATTSTTSTSSVVLTITFTCPSNATDIRLYMYGASANSDFFVNWVKLEEGSSFTGFVPKDYTNYGYNQGYSAGLEYGRSNFNTISGYSYVSSLEEELNLYDDMVRLISASSGGVGEAITGIWTPPLGTSIQYYDFTYQGYSFVQPKSVKGSFVLDGLTGIWTYTVGYDNNIPSGSVASVYLGQFSGYLPYYLFFDGSRVNNYGLIVCTVGYDYVQFLPLKPTSVIDGKTCMVFDFIQSGYVYDVYVVPAEYNSTYKQTVIKPGTVLGLTASSIVLGYGDWSVYLQADGYTVGQQSYNLGYDEGFSAGEASGYGFGYSAGYTVGVGEHTDYSFVGLIGAAVDVPIQAISGLLDINILGTNMKAFFLSLFSLTILIVIIRLVLGGR